VEESLKQIMPFWGCHPKSYFATASNGSVSHSEGKVRRRWCILRIVLGSNCYVYVVHGRLEITEDLAYIASVRYSWGNENQLVEA
jgi:hypothetical protein